MVKHTKGRDVDGILLLDKPLGLSSNKALQTVKYFYQARKAGHTGSLDPLATGVLPICLGEATKFSQYILDADKVYLARIKLGEKTRTGDIEGEIIQTRSVDFDFGMIKEVTKQFLGEHLQTPSMFSAIKQNGKPLYKLARKGIEVERKARPVFIHELRVTSDQKLFEELQAIDIYVHCSKGTYIRNLGEDIGERAGCGAHLLSLRRVKAGQFDDMVELEELEQGSEAGRTRLGVDVAPSPEFSQYLAAIDRHLLPVDAALVQFPKFVIDLEQSHEIKFGRIVLKPDNPLNILGIVRLYEVSSSNKSEDDPILIFLGLAEIDSFGDLRGKRLLRTN